MSASTTHSPKFTNALIREKSPYLLQHAHNPVNWYAWNEETFAKAKREDKPIFLSIGYATCHWCHVMERESFENEAIAEFLNEHFVAIKVDREERPDVDAIYMRVCQAMTGHGGWPLTIFMSPDKKPFFAGTYFPPANYRNRPGFPHILEQILHAWTNERAKVEESCDAILEHFSEKSSNHASSALSPTINDIAFQRYEQTFDPQFGGFGSQPKFPSPQNLLFLLRYYKRTGNRTALAMVERTLISMRHGGLFDHIGYGFHRYSTDREWLLPHFEKMLYDQAMLAVAYLEAHQASPDKDKKEVFAQVAEEVFTYVLRDMTSPEGGFYSAEDADSEGHEGKFYVWSEEELKRVLGDDNAKLFAAAYNFSLDGNFFDEASGSQTGENIPHLRTSIEDFAKHHGTEIHELRVRLAVMREQLFYHREERVHPLKDDKILTDWNGLMIAAFAIGGRVLDNALYTQAAERALEFIAQKLTTASTERLLHRFRDGEAAIPAFLDDYAFLAWGALELYQTTFALKHLKTALRLADEMIRLFYDKADRGFRFSAADNEALLLQSKEGYDGAIPSGNSIAASVLARLGKLTSNKEYQDLAEQTIRRFAAPIQHHPTGFAQMLIANDFLIGNTQEIIIAGRTGDNETHGIVRTVAEEYLPHAVVALNHSPEELKHYIEQAEYQVAIKNQATTYICEGYVCQEPLVGKSALEDFLHRANRSSTSTV
ncbi:MAG: thioredoxin domain-containing protein [Candidatus Kapabacteria bacterium]|jgi:hypothetical protein|nr:thioredoxin domain-containing protein [Candidatus Kapabacteria bacterium]